MKYRGFLLDGMENGEGKLYDTNDNRLVFEGIFENGNRVKGKIYGNDLFIKFFEGTFKNNNPWNGYVEFGKYYRSNYIRLFKGELKEVQPYKGEGYRFLEDSRGYDYYYYTELEPLMLEQRFQDEGYEAKLYQEHEEMLYQEAKNQSSNWEEFIRCEWANGEIIEKENVTSNKKLFSN